MGNSMAAILRNVIRSGGMPLTQVSERIETMYLSGRISGEERAELTELMHSNANLSNEASDYKALYKALAEKYRELEKRVEALEEAAGGEAEGGEEAGEEIREWKPWDGISDRYQPGAVVSHNGNTWESTYTGQNVWEPGAMGVDERYWIKIG